jgi:hypothetical protein
MLPRRRLPKVPLSAIFCVLIIPSRLALHPAAVSNAQELIVILRSSASMSVLRRFPWFVAIAPILCYHLHRSLKATQW